VLSTTDADQKREALAKSTCRPRRPRKDNGPASRSARHRLRGKRSGPNQELHGAPDGPDSDRIGLRQSVNKGQGNTGGRYSRRCSAARTTRTEGTAFSAGRKETGKETVLESAYGKRRRRRQNQRQLRGALETLTTGSLFLLGPNRTRAVSELPEVRRNGSSLMIIGLLASITTVLHSPTILSPIAGQNAAILPG